MGGQGSDVVTRGTGHPALDVLGLADWLAANGIAEGPVTDVRQLTGGTQNLILRFSAGGRDLAMRRPPPDKASGLKTLRREALVLTALADSGVPHPRYHGLCEDKDIAAGPFIVTDEVKGFNATIDMPGRAASDPSFRHAMGLALIDGLAALASVSIDANGLDQLGNSEGFIERQVSRWASQLAGYQEIGEWPGADSLGPVAAIGAWLRDNLPSDFQPGLMHGDYHIANVMFREADGRLAAILDWELATVGDPLLDLARLITTWPDASGKGLLSLSVTPWQGFPLADEMVERYAARTGRSMASFAWFELLACYKFAIILEGTFARACAGLADRDTGARLHASAQGLVAHAAALLDRR